MLPALPTGSVMAVDAGFVGYRFHPHVLDSQRHVLLRVGSNVRLLKKLGFARERANTVYLWPDREASGENPRSCCGWWWLTPADIRCFW